LSADHLEYSNASAVTAMARAGTVAVLLPGAFHVLRETQEPPIVALRAERVPMAIASDCNPGTSPVVSLVLMLNFACTLLRLTPEEALAGVTKHAARALGLADRGTLVAGQRADLVLWDIGEPAELAYRVGGNACAGIVRGGTIAHWPRS
jgi:imidazolonepropionase